MQSSYCEELSSYIEALRPIIYIPHFDCESIDKLVASAVPDKTVYEYNTALGKVDFRNKRPLLARAITLEVFLECFLEAPQDCALLLKDVHSCLSEVRTIALLKEIALRTMRDSEYSVTVIIASTELVIPNELQQLITVFEIRPPSENQIEEIIDQFLKDQGLSVSERKSCIDLVQAFRGLSEFEIRQILNLAYQKSGKLSNSDKILVYQEKKQIITKSGMLELIESGAGNEDIGGLEELQRFLKRKAHVFHNLGEARHRGVDAPKGVMIVGMPGCGKSLTAKASARLFNVPLLRLDIGKLMGKYVGESEGNLRRAIAVAEAVAPCILWVDEVEKAFAGIGGSSGGGEVATRLFGNFLTWLQEKESSVYVVATSNDVSSLPPEFLRKGRFDEVFFVELPNAEERKDIITIHLRKRRVKLNNLRTVDLINATNGFSGADIESAIKDAIEMMFYNEKSSLSTSDVLDAINGISPISDTLKDRIKQIRDNIKKVGARPASTGS